MINIVIIAINTLEKDSLINNLLRPYRSTYSFNDLGTKNTQRYVRKDDFVVNDRDQKILYSYYQQK